MSRDIQVKVMLDADEFLAFRYLCEEAGLSQSAKARMLIKDAIRTHAVSLRADDPATDEPGAD